MMRQIHSHNKYAKQINFQDVTCHAFCKYIIHRFRNYNLVEAHTAIKRFPYHRNEAVN